MSNLLKDFDWKDYGFKHCIDSDSKCAEHAIRASYVVSYDRRPAIFDWMRYIKDHPDLQRALGKKGNVTCADATCHYLNHGKREKRRVYVLGTNNHYVYDFDWKMYDKLNPDVFTQRSRGEHIGKWHCFRHWCEYGYNEGRKTGGEQLVVKTDASISTDENVNKLWRDALSGIIQLDSCESIDSIINITCNSYYPLVVMPTYNRAANIEHSIQMMINQTEKKWTFLIIDDGSTIENKTLFRSIQDKYRGNNQIVFLENEKNKHIAFTLNRGIQYFLQDGKFTHFTWVSDDNEYYPNFLEKLYISGKDFTYSWYDILYTTEKNKGKTVTNKNKLGNLEILLERFDGCAAFLWSRCAIRTVGMYTYSYPGCEDYEYLLRTFAEISMDKIEQIQMSLMQYLRHPGAEFEKIGINKIVEYTKAIKQYFKRHYKCARTIGNVNFSLQHIDTAMIITYPNNVYLKYYNNKKHIILSEIQKISNKDLIISRNYTDYLTFDTKKSKANMSDYDNIKGLFIHCSSNQFYIFDELDYCNLKGFYEINDEYATILIRFLTTVTYIISFSEIFENDNLQTVGNTSYNKQYSKIFFANSIKTFLCYSRNIDFLNMVDITDNIIYHPSTGFIDNLCIKPATVKDIDLLFYGTISPMFEHRQKLINIVIDISSKNNYAFQWYNNLHDSKKDDVLSRTKIVIHVASLPGVHTIPWAKITELMCKRVFFIIESTPEIYTVTVDQFCKSYDYDGQYTNIDSVINKYLSNPDERQRSIDRNYEYIQIYNTSKILGALINSYPLSPHTLINYNISIKTVKYWSYNCENFHSKLKRAYCNLMKRNSLHIIEDYSTPMLMVGHNFDIQCIIKVSLSRYLNDYLPDNESMYVFNTEDILFLFWILSPDNIDLIYNFLRKTKYVVWCYEVLIDENLMSIGLSSNWLLYNHQSFSFADRYRMLQYLYKNAHNIYTCSVRNRCFLMNHTMKNISDFPPFICEDEDVEESVIKIADIKENSETDQRFNPNDCILYGHLDGSPYRTQMIDQVCSKLNESTNIGLKVFDGNLYDHDKMQILSKTKIVLHIPSVENLHTVPWAKISELMKHKIFFIIEESDELYSYNLDQIVVFYKIGNINDLIEKIKYYIENDYARQKVIDKCYTYFTEKYDQSILLRDIQRNVE